MTAPRDRFLAKTHPLISVHHTDMTLLDRSMDRVCRCGTPMQNLAHSAFL